MALAEGSPDGAALLEETGSLPWEKPLRALRLSHIRRPKSSGQNPVVRCRHGISATSQNFNLRKFKNGEMQKARQYADRHVA